MGLKKREAFTLLELTFVIVIIGILSAVAIPRLAATRDDAEITRAIATVASVRNSLSMERQKKILRGNFDALIGLSTQTGYNKPIFDEFVDDNGNTGEDVLEYPLQSCANASARGCWQTSDNRVYTYKMPASSSDVDFNITSNRFICDETDTDCQTLSR